MVTSSVVLSGTEAFVQPRSSYYLRISFVQFKVDRDICIIYVHKVSSI